jgi:hypothetical protein
MKTRSNIRHRNRGSACSWNEVPTSVVTDFERATCCPFAVSKNTKVDTFERSQGNRFDDRDRDGGYEEQDECCEQQYRQGRRRSQHLDASVSAVWEELIAPASSRRGQEDGGCQISQYRGDPTTIGIVR